MRLVESLGAIRIRSDVVRKKLFGNQQSENAVGAGIYNAEASDVTYTKLHERAGIVLRAGFPVVLDATYLKRAQRDAAAKVAEATGVPCLILDCTAPDAVIEGWLAHRRALGTDPSDATLEVVKAQQASREPLGADEILHSKRVETHNSKSLDTLIADIRQRLPGL